MAWRPAYVAIGVHDAAEVLIGFGVSTPPLKTAS